MRASLIVVTSIALGACAPYAQPYPVAPPQAGIADPVGLIAAEPPSSTASFPGLLPLIGYGLAGGGTMLDAVLMGAGPP